MKSLPVSFSIEPIGIVRSEVEKTYLPEYFHGRTCYIEIYPEFEEALDGIEHEEFILVLFYFHKSEGYPLKVHPRGDPERPLRGVFATCSPKRPNFIGVTRCRLINRRGIFLEVKDLDALNGTPIIDIKPYRL